MGKITFNNQGEPTTPSSGNTEVYVDSADRHLKQKDHLGVVTDLTEGDGGAGETFVAPVLDRLTTPPGSPAADSRYLVIATATGDWVGEENNIAEWTGSAWVFTEAQEGMQVFVEDEDIYYFFSEGVWETLGTSIEHSDIQNSGTNTHAQIDTHIADSTIHFTEASIDHTNISNIGTNTHAQIDSHISSTSNPHDVTLEQARTENNQLSGDIDANSNTIINLPTPTNSGDVASKQYVDDQVTMGRVHREPVLDKDLITPPGSPSDEDRYIVAGNGGTATGAWAGEELNIAEYRAGSWQFSTPSNGWTVSVEDESVLYVYESTLSQWVSQGATTPTNLSNTPAAGNVVIESSTGTNTTVASATTSLAGVMSADDKDKLDDIEDNATKDWIGEPVERDDLDIVSTITGANQFHHPSGSTTQIQYSVSDTGSSAHLEADYIIAQGGPSESNAGAELVLIRIDSQSLSVETGYHHVTVTGELIKGYDEEPNILNPLAFGSIGDDVTLIFMRRRRAIAIQQADWNQTDNQQDDFIKNKPTLISGTDLGNTPAASNVLVTSSTGTDTTIPGATDSLAGVMSADDKEKLDTVEENATEERIGSVELNNEYEIVSTFTAVDQFMHTSGNTTSFTVTGDLSHAGAIEDSQYFIALAGDNEGNAGDELVVGRIDSVTLTGVGDPLSPDYYEIAITGELEKGFDEEGTLSSLAFGSVGDDTRIKFLRRRRAIDIGDLGVDLSHSRTATSVTITNTGGDNTTIGSANTVQAGMMSADDKEKLDNLFSNFQMPVIDLLSSPPASPSEGDRYLVGPFATGAWASQENNIAIRTVTAWIFETPQEGWFMRINNRDIHVSFSGTFWIRETTPWTVDSTGVVSYDGKVEVSDFQINTDTPPTPGLVWTATDTEGNGSWQNLGTREYIMPIWAEHNGGLDNDEFEWSFGNGADTPSGSGVSIYVPTDWTCEIIAMSAVTDTSSGSGRIAAEVNGTNLNSTVFVQMSGRSTVNELTTPYSISNGDTLNFKTTTAGTNSSPNVVTAYLRFTKDAVGGASGSGEGGGASGSNMSDSSDTFEYNSLFEEVYNGSGSQLKRGTPVYIHGVSGNKSVTASNSVQSVDGLMSEDANDGVTSSILINGILEAFEDDIYDGSNKVITPLSVDSNIYYDHSNNRYTTTSTNPNRFIGKIISSNYKLGDSGETLSGNKNIDSTGELNMYLNLTTEVTGGDPVITLPALGEGASLDSDIDEGDAFAFIIQQGNGVFDIATPSGTELKDANNNDVSGDIYRVTGSSIDEGVRVYREGNNWRLGTLNEDLLTTDISFRGTTNALEASGTALSELISDLSDAEDNIEEV